MRARPERQVRIPTFQEIVEEAELTGDTDEGSRTPRKTRDTLRTRPHPGGRRRKLGWAVVGGLSLLSTVAAVTTLLRQPPDPAARESPQQTAGASPQGPRIVTSAAAQGTPEQAAAEPGTSQSPPTAEAAEVPDGPFPGEGEAVEDTQEDPAARKQRLDEGTRLINTANRLRGRGDYKQAAKAYRQALSLYAFPRAMRGMAQLELARGNAVEAVSWAARLNRRQPKRKANLVLLGDTMAKAGRKRGARRAWLSAAKLGSQAAKARLGI